EEAELKQRTDPGQVVEPAAGHLRTALDVDRAQRLADLQVVARLGKPRTVADLTEHDEVVLAAGGWALLDDVGHRELRVPLVGLRRAGRCLGILDLLRQLFGTPEQRLPLEPARRRHLLAELLLLGTQRLEPGDRGAAGLVGAKQVVNDALRLATGAL